MTHRFGSAEEVAAESLVNIVGKSFLMQWVPAMPVTPDALKARLRTFHIHRRFKCPFVWPGNK